MRLGVFEQAAVLGAGLAAQVAAAMEGDRIALAIRHGRIDARTPAGEARYVRLDEVLAATEALALQLLAGRLPDGEERRRLVDRVAALAARNRHTAAVELYDLLLANGIDVPAWALADVAAAYLTQRQPRAGGSSPPADAGGVTGQFFRQRLLLTAGNYRQSSFASGSMEAGMPTICTGALSPSHKGTDSRLLWRAGLSTVAMKRTPTTWRACVPTAFPLAT